MQFQTLPTICGIHDNQYHIIENNPYYILAYNSQILRHKYTLLTM